MDKQQLIHLLRQRINDTISGEELAALDHYLQHEPDKLAFVETMTQLLMEHSSDQVYDQQRFDPMIEYALGIDRHASDLSGTTGVIKLPRKSLLHSLQRKWVRYAAAVLLITIGIVYYFGNPRNGRTSITEKKQSLREDFRPGGNKAILTLSDGTTITLDSAANGAIARQGNASIVKMANGQIVYTPNGQTNGQVLMNTMRTPKGGQYQLRLPDGTAVWLNAASAITYPAVFVGKDRKVHISGEAYFEVAKDASKPFLVEVNEMATVEVLGTHFNINSYGDEGNITTTLLEGSVRVVNRESGIGKQPASQRSAVILKPGQQALLSISSQSIKSNESRFRQIQVQTADIESVMAWKNGLFDFRSTDLQTALQQLSRWYDIEIRYEGKIPRIRIQGKMERNLRLPEILEFLQKMDVHFRIEGRTMIVQGQ